METENIGPTHPHFDQTMPNFTQVIVWRKSSTGDKIKVAQFYGLWAKRNAKKFCASST